MISAGIGGHVPRPGGRAVEESTGYGGSDAYGRVGIIAIGAFWLVCAHESRAYLGRELARIIAVAIPTGIDR